MFSRRYLRNAAVLAVLVAVLGSASVTYAWLKNSVSQPVNLGTDPSPALYISMGTYQPGTQGGAGQYVWSNWTAMEPDHVAVGSFGAEFNPQSPAAPEFGTIDNLDPSAMKDSNRVWLCLKIHEDEGKKFSNLRIQYAEEPVLFYGTDRTGGQERLKQYTGLVTPQMFTNLMYVRPGDPLVSAAAPGTEPAADTVNPPDSIRLASDTANSGFSGQAPAQVDADGYYYVYLQIEPNVDAYYTFVRDLYTYMPCYLNFQNMKVTVDVTTK